MKKILHITISLLLVFGMTSCDKWLDVNVDPDNPTEEKATAEVRLSWIQHYYAYALGTANMRTSTIAGLLTQSSATAANGLLAAWNPAQGSCTTIYQNWLPGAAVNIQPMIDRATETGAYHYLGAAHAIRALGFLLMLDLHGEMPYKEALGPKYTPAYDKGEDIYEGCMADLDLAIEYFQKTQEEGAVALAVGDTWNNGDVNKWIKMCYGIKARYLNIISKKSTYNPEAILAALENAPKSNAQNTSMRRYNIAGDATNFTVGDPYQTNNNWNAIGYGEGQRTTRWYVNLLTNSFTGGSGVIDPRMPKLLPATMTNIVLNTAGEIVSYQWKRDIGVDMMNSKVRQEGGPLLTSYAVKPTEIKYTITDGTAKAAFIAGLNGKKHTVTGDVVAVTYRTGAFYINSTNYKRAGDTVYVNMRTNSLSTAGRAANDMFYYPVATSTAVAGTGVFSARPDSDFDIVTYAEMCFIKAEVYLRQGKSGPAHQAYLEGIQASFDRMQLKLNEWKAAGSKNPDEMPMNPADIAAYMASAAVVQTPANLKMADIIKEKIIAMGFDYQNWNDMRRFNYSAGNIGNFGVVYRDYKRPYEFTATNKLPGASPTDLNYWFRRFSQSTHESNYNYKQLMASHPLAMQDAIWSAPVWWDMP